ncbi:hydantoinase/oxoprolinase [Candidatus Vecturithrix granuli]|uniref:Hydantoinase/oxoprolinase n=1 Tax=Vecturithrix granuli TaxID=1499967 RepID=A0A081BWJ0_VECG1|nr:hydantoinase/oxoprolinase [Candidatus Vecturithrix granuli]
MSIALGIDTGGTYTDAVLIEQPDERVIAHAKALTTYHDLSLGIREAIMSVLAGKEHTTSPAAIELVGLSTTLATNAIVEGHGGRVCLLLLGYDPDLVQKYGFTQDFVTPDVVYIRGGHNEAGEETEPLDEAAVRAAILARRDRVDAFAISGFFSVRNPAHELRVRTLVEELTKRADGLATPVTCGHELTSQLNSIRRATTTVLNARLIPLLRDLIVTVRQTLDTLGIAAPLMIVKGDGSLVRAEWAMQRPIETILSGPAASVVGAWHLAGREDVWVVDVGGTTTDIAQLEGGRPRLNPEGAHVGRWQTMVEAVDIHTIGLGGDSQVTLPDQHASVRTDIVIGPRRVMPLCVLASQYPHVLSELRHQRGNRPRTDVIAAFVLAQRPGGIQLSDRDALLLEILKQGPRSLASFLNDPRLKFSIVQQVRHLSAHQAILQAGFTPTDALHVLGQFKRWNCEAARLGAELLAEWLDMTPEDFCQQVITEVSERIARELLRKSLSQDLSLPNWEHEPTARILVNLALNKQVSPALECQMRLKSPVVAIGAPVEAYVPQTVQLLHTEGVIPPYAEVANAVGAVVGGVIQRSRVLVHHLEDPDRSVFRFYLPDGYQDFADLEEGITIVKDNFSKRLEILARDAGAAQVEIHVQRQDSYASSTDQINDLYLKTELCFTAIGRPGVTAVRS